MKFKPLFILLFLINSVAFSQDEDLDPYTMSLQELMQSKVITASKLSEDITDAPGIISRVTAREIEQFGANSLFEILERVSGSYMIGSNFFPQNVMSMRGDLLTHYGNHVLILINGRPFRETYAGGTNMSLYTSFPISQISQIEIIRGPGSVLYGTNAYTGVINIITHKNHKKAISATLGTGSFKTLFPEIAGTVSKDDFSFSMAARAFKEEGWELSAIDNNGIDSSMHCGEENSSLFISSSYKNFSLTSVTTNSSQNFLGSSIIWRNTPVLNDRKISSLRHFTDLSYTHDHTDKWKSDAYLTYNYMNFELSNYTSFSNNIQAEYSSSYSPFKQVNFLVGAVAWYQSDGSIAGERDAPVPDYSAIWCSAYAQVDYSPIKQIKIIGGGQLNKPANIALDFVPRVGVIAKLNENFGAKMLYAQAFRSAFGVETDFNLLFYDEQGDIRAGLRGNPNLLPEKISTTDAQLFYKSRNTYFAGTVFQSTQKQLITRERAADGALDFVNNGELYSKGIEFEAKVIPLEKLLLSSSFAYQINENELEETDITSVPNYMVKSGIMYQAQTGLSLGVFHSFIGRSNHTISVEAQVNPEAKAYNLITANLGCDFIKLFKTNSPYKIELNLYGYNLLDQNIMQPEFVGKKINTIPARQGRSVYAKITVSHSL